MNNDIAVFYNPRAVFPFPQVNIFTPGNADVFFFNSFIQELVNYPGAKKTGSSRYEDFFI